jgi:hypothetical protein
MKLGITYLLILGVLLTYGYFFKQSNIKNVPQKNIVRTISPKEKARDIERKKEISKIKTFLDKYDSPLANEAENFVDAEYIYGLDYRLLPSIAGAESTFGKFPPKCALYNPFGYSSSTSPCGWYRFGNYREAIWKVAETLGNKDCYSEFRQTGSIEALAKNYSQGSETWIKAVNYFEKQI